MKSANVLAFLLGLSIYAILNSVPANAGWITPAKWEPVEAPYGAPKGTLCWVHGGGWGDAAWGGPWCWVPTPVSNSCR